MSVRAAAPLLASAVAATAVAACGDAGSSADTVEDRLTAVTAAYYVGLADGDADAVRGAVCRAAREDLDPAALAAAVPEQRTELVELREVRVEGDSAQAIAVLTAPGTDRRQSHPLQYRYEDGWTLC